MMKHCASIVLTLALLTSFEALAQKKGAKAQPQPTPIQTIPTIQPLPKGVSIHQLNNGMQVLLIENASLPMVGVNVAVKVGSAYETFRTSGMSHMLEHLLFNGTTSRDQKQLYDDVDRIGGYINATTADFYTNYMMVTPTENIRKGMEIQADMLFNSTLPVDKFKKEQGIVLEEISKSLASAQEQLERNMQSILYEGHALSLPTLGTFSTIEAMTRDAVQEFYRDNYVANNMVMNVVGNFKSDAMLAMIKEIYGKARPGQVTRSQDPEWATGFQVPKRNATVVPTAYHRFYDGQDLVVQVCYQIPAKVSSEYLQLMSMVMEKNKDAIQAALKAEFQPAMKSLKFSTRPSHLGNYLEAVVLLGNAVEYDLLVNALTKKLAAMNFKLPSETVQSEVTKARTEFVKNIEKPHMFGIYNSSELVKNGIEAVLASFSGTDFYQAAKDLESLKIDAHPYVIIQTPSLKESKEQHGTAAATKLFEDKKTGKSLVAAQNEASNLLAVHYLVKHKAVYESKYGKDAAKVLHECLDQRLKSDANQKLSNRFGLTFTVNDNPLIPMDDIYLHPDFGYIRAEGLADDVAGALNYLNGQLNHFTPTEEEFSKAIEKFKGIEMMSSMGGDKAKKAFDQAYTSNVYEANPYSQNQPVLTYEALLAFAKEYLVPANMIISVVSPLGPDSIDVLFSAYVGAPIANEPTVFTPTFMMPTKPVTVEQSLGGERAYLSWGFIKQVDPKDAAALQALSLVLSDEIVFDIREKQGMAYNMSAGIELIRDKALFFITQGTRSQNVDKLIPQYPRFFRANVLDSLTASTLEKSINMYLGRMMFRRLSSVNQAFYIGSSLYFFNDYRRDRQLLDDLRKVTVSDVRAVAKKYMTIENPILIVVK